MLEIIYAIILSGIFFLVSRVEIRFERNRDKYIDPSQVFLEKPHQSKDDED